jgi:protein-tyrosine phosphatase
MKKRTVLFVCTGNVFRSMSAEFALRSKLPENAGIEVGSAGTGWLAQRRMRADVADAVARHGYDAMAHVSRPLTQELVDGSDLIVAMSTDHQKTIRERFNREAVLYMEIVDGRKIPLLDLPDVMPDYKQRKEDSAKFVSDTVDKIFANADTFHKRLPQFLP